MFSETFPSKKGWRVWIRSRRQSPKKMRCLFTILDANPSSLIIYRLRETIRRHCEHTWLITGICLSRHVTRETASEAPNSNEVAVTSFPAFFHFIALSPFSFLWCTSCDSSFFYFLFFFSSTCLITLLTLKRNIRDDSSSADSGGGAVGRLIMALWCQPACQLPWLF